MPQAPTLVRDSVSRLLDYPPGLVTVVLLLTGGVLVSETASGGVADFFAKRPLQAGFVSGILLSLVISIFVRQLFASARELKWVSVRIAAFEALAYEVTLVIDTLNWLVTGHLPGDEAMPLDGQRAVVDAALADLGEAVPLSLAHALPHADYRARLAALVDAESDDVPPWVTAAQDVIVRRRVEYRNGLAKWAATLVETGELAQVMTRVAALNVDLGALEEWLRVRRGRSGFNQWRHLVKDLPDVWTDVLGEALSLREDLWREAKGGTDPVWVAFRAPAPPSLRARMAARQERFGGTGRRRLVYERITEAASHPARLSRKG